MAQPTKQQTTDAIITIGHALGWTVVHESNPSTKKRNPAEPACILVRDGDTARVVIFYVKVKGRLNENEQGAFDAFRAVAAPDLYEGLDVYAVDFSDIVEVPAWLS